MKRIIDISEEQYKWVKNVNKSYDDYGLSDFIDLIVNSTPLNEVGAEESAEVKTLKDYVELQGI